MTAATQIAGVAGAVVLVAGTALALAAQHLGIFKKVKWTEGPMEELEFVYVEHKGSYKNIGNAFELLAKALTEKGVAVTQQSHTFVGVYKDDPTTVPAEELTSLAGVVLDSESAQHCGLPSKKFEAQQSLQTVFPFYGFLSILVAVNKCYPALDKAFADSGEDNKWDGECIEVYELGAKTITFHAVKK